MPVGFNVSNYSAYPHPKKVQFGGIRLSPKQIAQSVHRADQDAIRSRHGYSSNIQVEKTIESYLETHENTSGDSVVRRLKNSQSSASLREAVQKNSGTWSA